MRIFVKAKTGAKKEMVEKLLVSGKKESEKLLKYFDCVPDCAIIKIK